VAELSGFRELATPCAFFPDIAAADGVRPLASNWRMFPKWERRGV
jgi:hypothetical protein